MFLLYKRVEAPVKLCESSLCLLYGVDEACNYAKTKSAGQLRTEHIVVCLIIHFFPDNYIKINAIQES